MRSTNRACSTPPGACRTGRSRRRRSRPTTAGLSARRSTAATSARTSVPGIAASRSVAPPRRFHRRASRTSGWPTGFVMIPQSLRSGTTGSTCRATTPAISAGMRSWRSATRGPATMPSWRSPTSQGTTSCFASRRNGLWGESRSAMATERPRFARWREIEVWIARVRLAAVAFSVVEVGILTETYPPHYERYAWITVAAFAAGAALLYAASKRVDPRVVGPVALLFDATIIGTFGILYSFEYGSPTRWALMFVVVEAALRYGLIGSLAVPLLLFPYLVFAEWWRAHHFGGPSFIWDRVTFPFGVFLVTGVIVGWLGKRLAHEATLAETRAREAETLRDELGRRVDVLDAANRCARALASSLELDQAF